MTKRQRFLRWWTYFRRGHNTYMIFFISFSNFIVIQYRLLVEEVPLLKYIFNSLLAFAISFFILYVPIAILIGWYDYKRFAVPVDTALLARANPWVRDLAKALILIAKNENEEAINILKRWVEEV